IDISGKTYSFDENHSTIIYSKVEAQNSLYQNTNFLRINGNEYNNLLLQRTVITDKDNTIYNVKGDFTIDARYSSEVAFVMDDNYHHGNTLVLNSVMQFIGNSSSRGYISAIGNNVELNYRTDSIVYLGNYSSGSSVQNEVYALYINDNGQSNPNDVKSLLISVFEEPTMKMDPDNPGEEIPTGTIGLAFAFNLTLNGSPVGDYDLYVRLDNRVLYELTDRVKTYDSGIINSGTNGRFGAKTYTFNVVDYSADDYIVVNANDSGRGSLRAALEYITNTRNNGGKVVFGEELNGQTIALRSALSVNSVISLDMDMIYENVGLTWDNGVVTELHQGTMIFVSNDAALVASKIDFDG
ncbi:MAG: hypothetical protein RRY34_06770, partial [Victivallaceae bacterium]